MLCSDAHTLVKIKHTDTISQTLKASPYNSIILTKNGCNTSFGPLFIGISNSVSHHTLIQSVYTETSRLVAGVSYYSPLQLTAFTRREKCI